MANIFGNYIIIEGQRYDLPDNPTSEELGEYQDRSYGRVEKIVDKTFDIDKEN